MKLFSISIILSSFLCVVSVADEKKVTLKPEVQLELVKQQADIYKLALQMKQLETQYQAAQSQLQAKQAKLQLDTKAAIAKSGLDDTKYEINAETFDITPKPVVPKDTK